MKRFRVVGLCEETGQQVVAGLFGVYETYGIPLPNIMSSLFAEGYLVSKEHLIQEMIQAGVSRDRAEQKIKTALLELK